MFIYVKLAKVNIKNYVQNLFFDYLLQELLLLCIGLLFLDAIDESNISIALAMFSTGAFFASLIEPIIYKRRIIWYEILFGIIVIIGVFIITQSEIKYINGIILGISSAFFSSLFAVLNGKFFKTTYSNGYFILRIFKWCFIYFNLYFLFWRWVFNRIF